MLGLPTTATAPFCPTEVQGSIALPPQAPWWQRLLKMAGPGLMISVGYMDPGNWATDLEAGSRFGTALLWVVGLASLAAMLLQTLALRLGLAGGLDLAQACRRRYPRWVSRALWLMAELAIVACDVAEVLGTALALHLLFGLSLLSGVAITALDAVLVLGLKGRGFRQLEAIVGGLVGTIAVCFAVQIALVEPDWVAVAAGFVPTALVTQDTRALLLAVGILGATVMPHNLYLHSSIVQTRRIGPGAKALDDAIRLCTLDTLVSLGLALLINAAILTVSATAFHAQGQREVSDIQQAYHLLEPLVGSVLAPLLFGIALLAAGQSSTFTGTIAGQVIMDGFMDWKIPCWQRRLITRMLALVPAFAGLLWLGEAGVGTLLVASQVVLSLQLPFAVWPLLRLNEDPQLMGAHRLRGPLRALAWGVLGLIVAANAALLLTGMPTAG